MKTALLIPRENDWRDLLATVHYGQGPVSAPPLAYEYPFRERDDGQPWQVSDGKTYWTGRRREAPLTVLALGWTPPLRTALVLAWAGAVIPDGISRAIRVLTPGEGWESAIFGRARESRFAWRVVYENDGLLSTKYLIGDPQGDYVRKCDGGTWTRLDALAEEPHIPDEHLQMVWALTTACAATTGGTAVFL